MDNRSFWDEVVLTCATAAFTEDTNTPPEVTAHRIAVVANTLTKARVERGNNTGKVFRVAVNEINIAIPLDEWTDQQVGILYSMWNSFEHSVREHSVDPADNEPVETADNEPEVADLIELNSRRRKDDL